VTLRYDLNGDGDFDDTDVDGDDETGPQLVERFTADDDGFVPQPLDHDAAGNLTFVSAP